MRTVATSPPAAARIHRAQVTCGPSGSVLSEGEPEVREGATGCVIRARWTDLPSAGERNPQSGTRSVSCQMSYVDGLRCYSQRAPARQRMDRNSPATSHGVFRTAWDEGIIAGPFRTAAHRTTEARVMMVSRSDIRVETGKVLRSARRARGMTLRDVGIASGGRFKPTAVAGYERGERSISVERFCELSQLYDMAPERLMSLMIWRRQEGTEPVIDLRGMDKLPHEERDALNGFIGQVRRMRTGRQDDTIKLRLRDLEVLATLSGHKLDEFLERLRPALV
jgi:transcriptional regulator with XRE-family HTH domain